MINFNSNFSNLYSNDEVGKKQYITDLKNISNSESLSIQEDGKIVNADKKPLSYYEKLKGFVGFKQKDDRLVEKGVTELLKFGATRHWIDKKNEYLIPQIANRFGLSSRSIEGHRELYKAITKFREVDAFPGKAVLRKLGDENTIQHLHEELTEMQEDPNIIKLYKKKLFQETGIENHHQIGQLLSTAGTSDTDWVLGNEDHDAFLATLPFKDAFTALAGGYQLALLLKNDEERLGGDDRLVDQYQEAADAFKKRLQELIETHPKDYQKIDQNSFPLSPFRVAVESDAESGDDVKHSMAEEGVASAPIQEETEKPPEVAVSPPSGAPPPPAPPKVYRPGGSSMEEKIAQFNEMQLKLLESQCKERADPSSYTVLPSTKMLEEKLMKEKLDLVDELIQSYQDRLQEQPESKELSDKLKGKIEQKRKLETEINGLLTPISGREELDKFRNFTNEEIFILIGVCFEDYDFKNDKTFNFKQEILEQAEKIRDVYKEGIQTPKVDFFAANKETWITFFKEGGTRLPKLLGVLEARQKGKEKEPIYQPKPYSDRAANILGKELSDEEKKNKAAGDMLKELQSAGFKARKNAGFKLPPRKVGEKEKGKEKEL